jgi:tetratricopeptide (TPR) repeat protein
MNEDEATAEIKALRDAGNFQRAVERGYQLLEAFPNSWKVRGILAWSVYSLRVKGALNVGQQPGQIAAAVREIRTLTEHGPYGRISAYVLAVQEAASKLSEAGRHAMAYELLSEVDRTQLSKETSEFKGRRVSSQLEKWFNDTSKELSALEQWEPLRAICEEALASGLYKSDEDKLWLRYRLAISTVDSDPAEALDLIQQVILIKNESWAIRHRARCLYNLGQHDQAEQDCRVALGGVNLKKPEFAIKILEDMYNYTEDDETSIALLQTLRAIRIVNKWPKKDEYESAASDLGCGDASDFPFAETIARFADGEAFRAQKTDATGGIPRGRGKERFKPTVLGEGVKGTLVRLLPSQPNVGFAKVDGRDDVLITRNDNAELSWPPRIGTMVVGTLVETMDKKKNKKSAKFVNAREVS